LILITGDTDNCLFLPYGVKSGDCSLFTLNNCRWAVMKKTKIVCTIGPKTESEEKLEALLDAGMNVMRLNFSHGDYEEHGQRIKNLRAVCARTGKKAAILLDTKGPEIRTIKLEGGNDAPLV